MYMAISANASQSAPLVASTCQGGSQACFNGCCMRAYACTRAYMPTRNLNKKKAEAQVITGLITCLAIRGMWAKPENALPFLTYCGVSG